MKKILAILGLATAATAGHEIEVGKKTDSHSVDIRGEAASRVFYNLTIEVSGPAEKPGVLKVYIFADNLRSREEELMHIRTVDPFEIPGTAGIEEFKFIKRKNRKSEKDREYAGYIAILYSSKDEVLAVKSTSAKYEKMLESGALEDLKPYDPYKPLRGYKKPEA